MEPDYAMYSYGRRRDSDIHNRDDDSATYNSDEDYKVTGDRERLTPRPSRNKKSREEREYDMATPKENYNSRMSLHKPRRKKKEIVKRIDYVLVFEEKTEAEIDDKAEHKKNQELKKLFEKQLSDDEFIEMQKERIGDSYFLKLHTPFYRLCQEAEKVKLEMPLKGCELYDDDVPFWNFWQSFEDKYLETDNEEDFVAAPFVQTKISAYEGSENEDKFFRPSIRSLLTHHILINMDIRNQNSPMTEDNPMSKMGLPYMLHAGVYKDAFILHDETADDPAELEEIEMQMAKEKGQTMSKEDKLKRRETSPQIEDPRRELHDTWTRFFKYQPMWKIRNYFGEKITLYFAWVGVLVNSLWIPTIWGVIVFIYGLVKSINSKDINTDVQDLTGAQEVLTQSLDSVKEAFDNNLTPWFALVVCLWGTIFLEVWKRKNSTLAYEWDVDNYEASEPDRPQFYGTQLKPDPVTKEFAWFYPAKKQLIKYLTSASVLVIMVLLVCISAASVILYRVIMSIDYCGTMSPAGCLIVTTVASSLLNAISILILGKVYDKLAAILTDWENHRTQTQYDDALILKLFAFQFANSYTSLFYIAFFRGYVWPEGIFGLGPEYQDTCGSYNYTVINNNGTEIVDISNTNSNCMSMLSFQVLTMMLVKPFPKFFKDVILAWLLKKWRMRTCCRKGGKVDDSTTGSEPRTKSFLERENMKPDLGNFTLGEYTEKVIIYGYLVLFAASFSLAPLIVLLVNVIDIRVDARRMLWMYRRPLATIRQDIGMWYNILQFLNICGVLSNAFLMAYTSQWGQQWSDTEKLWVVIIFENAVFAIKFILSVMIPDVPKKIKLAQRREKYQVQKILSLVTEKPYEPKDRMGEIGLLGANPSGSKLPKIRTDTYDNDDYYENDERPKLRGKKKKVPTATLR